MDTGNVTVDLLGWACFAAAIFAVWFAGRLTFRDKRYGYAFLAFAIALVLFVDTPPYCFLFGGNPS